jgi:hypothetical protein
MRPLCNERIPSETHSVCPELVEGLPFLLSSAEGEGQGFDRLSPNGRGILVFGISSSLGAA